jgi:hypothetical protein
MTHSTVAEAQDRALAQLAETSAALAAETARIAAQPAPRFLPAVALALGFAGLLAGLAALAVVVLIP